MRRRIEGDGFMKRLTVAFCALVLVVSGCVPAEKEELGSPGVSPAAILSLEEDRTVYDQDSLDVITLNVTIDSGATIAEINADTDFADNIRPEALVTISEDGYTFPNGSASATGVMRMRGHSTRTANQKSYRIRLDDRANLYRNIRTIELNKHPYDLTRLRQKLAFDYFKTIDNFTSLRSQFVRLYIDGVDYGLYTWIERCNERFLRNHGLDGEGFLYKAEFFEFQEYKDYLYNLDHAAYNKDRFEEILEIRGKKNNHVKIITMLKDLNDEDIDINTTIARHFERENYLTWFAINILLRNKDTNSQNFYLYSPLTSNGWYFMPWDYDGGWDYYGQPSVDGEGRGFRRWTIGISNWWNPTIHKRFLKDANNRADLVSKVEEIKDLFLEETTEAYLDAFEASVRDILLQDPDFSNLRADASDPDDVIDEWENELDRLPGIIEESYDIFIASLQRPMPIFLTAPTQDGDQMFFTWDESYDFQGDSLTYDFEVSNDPGFADENIVYESLGRTGTSITIDAPAAGTYYYRVTVRDSADPDNNWQLPFDTFFVGDTVYDGIMQFSAE